jgi:peptidoglycan-associated lipoprotein
MRRFAVVVLASSLALALAGCGPKRPPNLSSAESGGSSRDASSAGDVDRSGTGVSEGDINPVDPTGLAGADIPGDMDVTRESGPLDDVYFEFDQYALGDDSKAVLSKHAAWLAARPTVKVMVEGHCDERGTVEYNLALGDKRARAARDYLTSLGVPEGRLSAISLGKERPKDPGHDEAAWTKNRRAHFAVSR